MITWSRWLSELENCLLIQGTYSPKLDIYLCHIIKFSFLFMVPELLVLFSGKVKEVGGDTVIKLLYQNYKNTTFYFFFAKHSFCLLTLLCIQVSNLKWFFWRTLLLNCFYLCKLISFELLNNCESLNSNVVLSLSTLSSIILNCC